MQKNACGLVIQRRVKVDGDFRIICVLFYHIFQRYGRIKV